MLWLVYALLAVSFSTIFALLARIIGMSSQHPRAYTVIFEVLSALFSLLLITIEPLSLRPVSGTVIVLTILTTLCYGVNDRLLFFINKSIEASSLTIIDKLVPVVTFLASFFCLGKT
jgi:uncharacterized membrane protein